MKHVVGMLQNAEQLLTTNPELNPDILYTGCLIHDLGKIEAYRWRTSIEMNDEGRLMHHSVLGYGILHKFETRVIDGFYQGDSLDETVMLKLKHICISHHDKEEGAVRRPMFPEAVAVSMLDNLDAAVNVALTFIAKPENQELGGNWTRYNKLAERSYFMPKETKPIEAPEPKPTSEDSHEVPQ